ncbi:MAG: L-rhamnose isomerase [Candidatus Oleimicrobiaceae bacterium]
MHDSYDERLYRVLAERLEERGVDPHAVEGKAMSLCIETPSWGYGDSGTRFKVFRQPGAARTIYEKLQDAAEVHRLTGIAPRVAIHIPWDMVDDFGALAGYAKSLGVTIGAVNPNLFEDDDYKFGSVTNISAQIRQKAVAHMKECIEIAKQVGSDLFTPWFADGTNYPGQGDFRQRKHWLEECLREVYDAMPESMTMAIEYKFFEPAFYHTDLADWGTVYAVVSKLGPRAKVLVDLGHHPLGTNIEHIVAVLLDEGRLGGFHLNSKKYADDDMTVGSHAPYELFLIFNELVKAQFDRERPPTVAYMIDQSHAIKPKVEAMIQSVLQVQQTYCKALLVDRDALASAQLKNDVVAAEMILREAFETDVRPLLAHARVERGLPPDPLQEYRRSGYLERVVKERSSH